MKADFIECYQIFAKSGNKMLPVISDRFQKAVSRAFRPSFVYLRRFAPDNMPVFWMTMVELDMSRKSAPDSCGDAKKWNLAEDQIIVGAENVVRAYFSRIFSEVDQTNISTLPDAEETFQQEILDAIEDYLRELAAENHHPAAAKEAMLEAASTWHTLVKDVLSKRS